MRILHAADLHLGRSFHERDLGPDQAHLLASLAGLAASREAEVLLLAGDLYDRAIPPPEAIRLFDDFLRACLSARPGLAIIAIPGNHDSASRLGFASGLLERAGLYLRARPGDCAEPIILGKAGDEVAFWALPYLNPGAFSEGGEAGPVGQEALIREALGRMAPGMARQGRNVLIAHCFTSGASPSESERGFIGAAEEVGAELFEGFDYVALGHLHRRQSPGPRVRYPGSPLAYSFSEAQVQPEKGFLLIDLGREGFTEEFLPLTPLHRVVRLQASFADLCLPGAGEGHQEDFVEIRLTDPEAILDPVDALRVNFPNLLSLRQDAFEIRVPGEAGGEAAVRAPEGAADLPSVLEDFRAFHRELKASDAPPHLEALFSDLLVEAEHAAP